MCLETNNTENNGLGGFTRQEAENLDEKTRKILRAINSGKVKTGGDLWQEVDTTFTEAELKYIGVHFFLEKYSEIKAQANNPLAGILELLKTMS